MSLWVCVYAHTCTWSVLVVWTFAPPPIFLLSVTLLLDSRSTGGAHITHKLDWENLYGKKSSSADWGRIGEMYEGGWTCNCRRGRSCLPSQPDEPNQPLVTKGQTGISTRLPSHPHNLILMVGPWKCAHYESPDVVNDSVLKNELGEICLCWAPLHLIPHHTSFSLTWQMWQSSSSV